MQRLPVAYALSIAALVVLALSAVHGVAADSLLRNGGFESGSVEPWSAYGAATTRIVATDTPEGTHALEATGLEQGANP